jgi:hypothetical protein
VEEYVLPAGQEPWWMRRWPPGVGRSWGREVLRLGGTPPACRGVAVLGMKIQFRVQYGGGRLGLGCGLVAERSTFGTIIRRIFCSPFLSLFISIKILNLSIIYSTKNTIRGFKIGAPR